MSETGQTTAKLWWQAAQFGDLGMAKTEISSADLVWVFTEKLKPFRDCAPAISIAIVPNKDGWTAIASRNDRKYPPALRRAYRAGSEGASRDLRSGEGLIPAFNGVGSPAPGRLKEVVPACFDPQWPKYEILEDGTLSSGP
jgi:hypothetical protein